MNCLEYPDIFSALECQITNNTSFIIGLILGVVISAIFFIIQIKMSAKVDKLVEEADKRRTHRRILGIDLLRQPITQCILALTVVLLGNSTLLKSFKEKKYTSESDSTWDLYSVSYERLLIASKSCITISETIAVDLEKEDSDLIKDMLHYCHEYPDLYIQLKSRKDLEPKLDFIENVVEPFLREYRTKLKKFTDKYGLDKSQQQAIDELEKITQKNNDAEPFIKILNCLKDSGIDDPNLDLFLGAILGNAELVKSAVAKGADASLTDKQLVSKHRKVIEKNCPDALKEWEQPKKF